MKVYAEIRGSGAPTASARPGLFQRIVRGVVRAGRAVAAPLTRLRERGRAARTGRR